MAFYCELLDVHHNIHSTSSDTFDASSVLPLKEEEYSSQYFSLK